MKQKFLSLLMLVSFFCQSNMALGQKEYYLFSYVKVAPNMQEDYLKLEKTLKKIHLEFKGSIDDWSLMQPLTQVDVTGPYNYIVYYKFNSASKLGDFIRTGGLSEDWVKLLTPEERSLVWRRNEIRTLVKDEVWEVEAGISAPKNLKNGMVLVFNYFDFPTGGSHALHLKAETEIWMPIHDLRIKNDLMSSWLFLKKTTPFGTSQSYQDATFDIYNSMEQFEIPLPDKFFHEVHKDRNLDLLIKLTNDTATLVKGEVCIVVDGLFDK